jgi:2-haloacid dehalogenase
MDIDRRSFLSSAIGLAAFAAMPATLKAAVASPPRVVLFDAFPIFDPRPVAARVKEMFPTDGDALMDLWRTRQFEYTWLRTLSGRYANFWEVTRDALRFSARARKLELSSAQEDRLMAAYLELKPWPDVPDALHALKAAGLKLGFLSNFTHEMLQANIHGAGLDGLFDQVLSTDQAGAFKPDPRAYRLGLDAFQLPREALLFAAFAGWDAAGATAFGYPTFWVNRLGQPAEELGITADATGSSLTELVAYARR